MVAHGKVYSSYTFIFHIIPNHFNLHVSVPTQTFPRQMRRCLHQTLSVKTASRFYSDTEGDKNVQERGFTILLDHWNPHNERPQTLTAEGMNSCYYTQQGVKPGWDFSQPCRFHGCEFGCFLRQRRPSVQRQWVLLKPTTRKQWGYANRGSKSRMFFLELIWINYWTSG